MLHVTIIILLYVINLGQSMQEDIRLWFTVAIMSIASHKIARVNIPSGPDTSSNVT